MPNFEQEFATTISMFNLDPELVRILSNIAYSKGYSDAMEKAREIITLPF